METVTIDNWVHDHKGAYKYRRGDFAGHIFSLPLSEEDAPIGWLRCDGSEVCRTIYANLFAVIGTSYGTGDGTTTFNLPYSEPVKIDLPDGEKLLWRHIWPGKVNTVGRKLDKVRFTVPSAEEIPLTIDSHVTACAGKPVEAAFLMLRSHFEIVQGSPERSVTINLRVNAWGSPLAGKKCTFNVTFEGEGK